jgi:hypothetical protein
MTPPHLDGVRARLSAFDATWSTVAPHVLPHLSAAGHTAAEELGAALAAAQDAGGTQQLAQALGVLGQLLCGLPTPQLCNNPACANLAGPSELQLVTGKLSVCSGCKKACFCCRACQAAHWTSHKPACL